MIVPVNCGPSKLVIFDPENDETACYRYSLIEVEDPTLPPGADPSLPPPLPLEDALYETDHIEFVDADAAGGSPEKRYDVAWLKRAIAADDLTKHPSSKVAWLNARPSAQGVPPGYVYPEREVPTAKGKGKMGRHSRALFPNEYAQGYPPAAIGLVTAVSMSQFKNAAGAAAGETSEAALSWGLAIANFLSGVSWSTALLMSLIAFLSGVLVGWLILAPYLQKRPLMGRAKVKARARKSARLGARNAAAKAQSLLGTKSYVRSMRVRSMLVYRAQGSVE